MPQEVNQPLYSPASLLVLLTALIGTKAPAGNTEVEMRNAISGMIQGNDYDWSSEDAASKAADKYFRKLTFQLNKDDINCMKYTENIEEKNETFGQFCMFNYAFYDENVDLLYNFKQTCTRTYKFEFFRFNQHNQRHYIDQVNSKIRTTTNGFVKEVVKSDDLSRPLSLVSVLFLRMNWKHPLNPNQYYSHFEDRSYNKYKIKMLNYEGTMKYYENTAKKYRAVQIPTMDEEVVFLVILPTERLGYVDMLFRDKEIHELIEMQSDKHVKLEIPSFKTSSEINLIPAMNDVGITSLFSEYAELPGASNEKMHVSKMKQVVNLELDRNGITASAVSSGGTRPTGNYFGERVDFTCDQPFAYVVFKRSYRTTLFVGEYNRPDPEYRGFSMRIDN